MKDEGKGLGIAVGLAAVGALFILFNGNAEAKPPSKNLIIITKAQFEVV